MNKRIVTAFNFPLCTHFNVFLTSSSQLEIVDDLQHGANYDYALVFI